MYIGFKMQTILLKSPANKTSSFEEAHRKLSNKTFRKEVGNVPALIQKMRISAYPDCIQTGMYARCDTLER